MKLLIFCSGLAASVLAPAVIAQAVAVEPLDKIVAVVDEDVILQSELDRAVSNILAQAQAQNNGQLPPRAEIEKQVLDRLILTRVQVERATSTGIQVGDSEVDQAVARIAAQNQMTLEQLRTSLERDGFSFDEFRKGMREEVTVQRFRQRFAQSRVQVTDTEIDILLASNSLKTGEVRLQHILVGVPEGATSEQVQAARERAERVIREVNAGLTFQQAAIKYSEGQQALEGGDLGWRRYEEVPTAFADLVAGMNKGDLSQPIRGPNGFHIIRIADQREDTSAKVIREFKARHLVIRPSELMTEEQATARIQKLREQAIGGADFAELARKNSQDENTANLGGELDWFVAGEYGARVTEVVDSLKNGEISEPFRTELGWHILKREDSRERDRTQDYLRGQAREAILRRKAEEEFENYVRQLKAEAFIENRLAG
ncbi:MAG: peptidylprolyl isomerase [Pseudomonadota bacterium]|nr:peptidylprolyl isomerase [Pseudomonadota bacterium]